MANIPHRTLTGDDLHEPKDIASATANQIYVADGAASGTMTTVNNINRLYQTVRLANVSTASSVYTPCPIAGKILNIYSVIDGALGTANPTLSFQINAVAVTDGNIVITQSGSAAGDVDSSTPSAANTFASGAYITCTTDGASTNTVAAEVTYVIDTS